VFAYFLDEELKNIDKAANRYLEIILQLVVKAGAFAISALTSKYPRFAQPLNLVFKEKLT